MWYYVERKWQVKNVHRHLNERTIKDSYALPRSEEIIDSLDGNYYYTVLEKKYGYHQVEVEESHKQRTVITVGPLGFYDFNRLSFGPVTVQQHTRDSCKKYWHIDICFIYLDDLIIFS